MFELFDIVAGKVVIHPNVWGLPCFRKIWEADKDKEKQRANNVVSYIVLKNKWNSPYVLSMASKDIEPRLKRELFHDTEFQLTEDEIQAEQDYIGFQQTKLLKMLQNMLLKLDSISDWYVESLADELDAATIDKLLSGFSKVGKVREAIIDLERQIRAEEVSTGRVRGDAKVNDYELPKK